MAAAGGCSVASASVIHSGETQTSDPYACPDGRQYWAIDLKIGDELNVDIASLAFVDDDPYERAEVSFALPQVIVLEPAEVADALRWPEFSPVSVSEEGARRAEAYRDAARRNAYAAMISLTLCIHSSSFGADRGCRT